MTTERVSPDYVQTDGTVSRHYICDTTTERDAISLKIEGTLCFVKADDTLYTWDGAAWTFPLSAVLPTGGTSGQVLAKNSATNYDTGWVTGGGGGAPTDADYLVGTANAGLSAEIVVGTTPGGELGGTWDAPTVDATHSGSAHHAQSHGNGDHTSTFITATGVTFESLDANADVGSGATQVAIGNHSHGGGGGEAFPVGSVFIAVVSTNPGTLLGYGTWSAFGAGRVLVGLDSGDADFDTAEETGGAKTVTLTTNEMPAHTHTEQRFPTTTGASSGFTADTSMSGTPTAVTQTTASTGGGAAHSNVQPYIVVYMWKRTA